MSTLVPLTRTRQRIKIMRVLLNSHYPLNSSQIATVAGLHYTCVKNNVVLMEDGGWLWAPGGQRPERTQGVARYYMLTEQGRIAAERMIMGEVAT